MKYKSYQHIVKLGTNEVEGILNGRCYFSYKIDGTNACIWLKDDGTLGFGSRNRELGLDKEDNQGFMTAMTTDPAYKPMLDDIKKFFKNHPTAILYGEWLVPVNLKTYKKDAWRQFYVFDVYYSESEGDFYVPYPIYKADFDENYPNIKYIPIIDFKENPTEGYIKGLLEKTGDWLVSEGLGEGIVIKNYDYRNKYGRRTWAKVLTEDFLAKREKKENKTKSQKQEDNRETEEKIVELLTEEQINKEKSKVIENRQTDGWDMKFLPELFNRVFDEFLKDNLEIILKKFHNPTINFRTLKNLIIDKVKKTL